MTIAKIWFMMRSGKKFVGKSHFEFQNDLKAPDPPMTAFTTSATANGVRKFWLCPTDDLLVGLFTVIPNIFLVTTAVSYKKMTNKVHPLLSACFRAILNVDSTPMDSAGETTLKIPLPPSSTPPPFA